MQVSKNTPISEEKIKALIKEYEIYAAENGFKLNPNKKIVEAIVRRLLENKEKHGYQYCPCRRITGKPHEDEKIICPCFYHRDELEKLGHCHCMLFVK